MPNKTINYLKFRSFLIVGKGKRIQKELEVLNKTFGVENSKNSPDFLKIEPTKKHISIDAIRDLKKNIFQKPVSQKYKLTQIENAQMMTIEAQNALLKILEEPPDHALLVLITPSRAGLLPTIVSRTITVWASKENAEFVYQGFLEADLNKLLQTVSTIENANLWLDANITNLYRNLITSLNFNKAKINTKILAQYISSCIEAKKMIAASVNPKFVLFNLIFNLKLNLNPKP